MSLLDFEKCLLRHLLWQAASVSCKIQYIAFYPYQEEVWFYDRDIHLRNFGNILFLRGMCL